MAEVESLNDNDDSYFRLIENAKTVIQGTLEQLVLNNDNDYNFPLNTSSSNTSGEKPDQIRYSDIITNEEGHNDDIVLEYTEQENQENMDPL
ncbi:hypothetical protein JTB14_001476 [Gonioctena quinquepunctata]|nr:hypothetical protein JTB14_001476 [Gonioctena quinquepunctata]